MLRRLHPEQPESFAFTPDNLDWAKAQITKYPEGRQASAVIPLLWRAQEQEGWLSKPAIEYVADMLSMAYIRVLEVATFYFMFQLRPVGTVAHIQVCGTTSCMICGAEDLIGVCKDKINAQPYETSADGKLSWEEVECLGSCSNAPMAQIGKDYYEDLTTERFAEIIDELAAGKVPLPGPQNGRYGSDPLGGVTTLTEYEADKAPHNASVALAVDLGDTVKRIDGTEVPLRAPWLGDGEAAVIDRGEAKADAKPKPEAAKTDNADRAEGRPVDDTGITKQEAPADTVAKPEATADGAKPALFDTAPDAVDDLKKITGIGPKLEETLNALGVYTFAQIASWGAGEIAWVDENLDTFKGRIERDEWVAQAKALTEES